MRRWWKNLGLVAGGLASLGGIVASASAQFPPGPGGPMMGPPPGMAMSMPPGMTPPGMPAGMGAGAPGMAPGMTTAFGGNPNLGGMPPEFPNPAVPSKEPASPFSIKDDGAPNAFTTELVDNRSPRAPSLVVRTEYLGWWITPAPLRVPLVTSTTNFPNEVGAIGQPNTIVLVPASDSGVDYKLLQGVRTSVGFACGFLPPLEVSGFSFTRNYNVFAGGSNDATGAVLGRPVQLVDIPGIPGIGLNDVEFVNAPGFAAGNVSIISRLSMWNVEPNFFFNFADNGTIRCDFMFGYRHMDLFESLQIENTLTGINANVNFGGAAFPLGFQTTVRDTFNTRNAFDGGQIGIRSILDCKSFKIFADYKLAMGVTSRFLTIDGVSTLTPNTGQPPVNQAGGLMALPSNIGVTSDRSFTVIPEVNLTFSYQATMHIRLYGGYNLLYWPNVARPGDHITNAVDSRQVPTDQNFINGFRAGTPAFPSIVTRDLLAHGFFVGVEFGF